MRKLLLLMCVCLSTLFSWAQSRTVSGKITDNNGQPVDGASVLIKGSVKGTTTDGLGNFKISAKDGDVLVVSALNFSTKEVQVEGTSLNIILEAKTGTIDEVVVTALGIKREKKALGYAVTELKGDALTQTPNQNMVNALSGKVAGLQVTSSGGAPGQAATIVIRGGAKSITGVNEPLFVIDGIPVSNSADGNDNARLGGGGGLTPNRMADINPDDIESVSVLKGSAAAVLYGNRGSNGVILITTKSGKGAKGKPVVTVSSNVGFDKALKLPEYQTEYAQGNNGTTYAEGTSSSFGPKISGQEVFSPAANKNVKLSVHDPRKDFLKTGFTFNNNVSVSQTLEKTNYFLSVGNFKQTAIIPNQDYNRANIRFNITNQLTSKLSVGINLNYVKSWGDLPFGGQDGNNPFFALYHVPVSWDLNGYGYQRPDGRQINFRGGSFDNPLWTVNKTFFKSKNDHLLGGVNLNYKVLPWMDVSYRLGIDQYHDNRQSFKDINTGGNPNGFLSNDLLKREEITSTFVVNINRRFNKDFGFTLTAGQDYNQRRFDENTQTGTALALPGIAHMSNVKTFDPDYEYHSQRRLIGVFGDLKFDYKNYLYLGITGRNEWSSTLPVANRSYFYPGVNAGFVFTDAFNIDKNILSFGKVRAAYGKTSRDASPYQLQNVYIAANAGDGFTPGISFPFLGLPGYQMSTTVRNPELKPEFTKEFEVGTELKFLNNRIGLDFTYFNSKSTDGIIPIDVSPATGAGNIVINSGQTTTKGIEIGLNAAIIKSKNGFNWDMNIVFSRIRSKVVSIYKDLDKIYLGGFSGNPAIFAVKGQPYGSIIATGYQRDASGRIQTDDDGTPVLVSGMNLGKVEPDWTGGIGNTFSYKGVSLSVLFDIRQGGYIFSGTSELLDNYGVSKRSGEGRGENYVFPGVNVNTGKPNDVPVVKNKAWWNYMGGSDEAYVYKNNWVKLREITLAYSLKVKNSVIRSVDLGVYGRNLFLWSKVPDIDPEASSFGTGNAQGAVRMAYPSTRSLGMNLKLNF